MGRTKRIVRMVLRGRTPTLQRKPWRRQFAAILRHWQRATSRAPCRESELRKQPTAEH